MNAYERMEEKSCKDGVNIIGCDFKSPRIKGLYCNGTIGISNRIKTSVEKGCIAAEELGHHHTSVGDITDMTSEENRKQERQARLWAYNNQIGLNGLINAYEHRCKSRYDIAEYLEVTEEFLQECIECYREKYGVATTLDNYCIIFIPHLAVGKIIK